LGLLYRLSNSSDSSKGGTILSYGIAISRFGIAISIFEGRHFVIERAETFFKIDFEFITLEACCPGWWRGLLVSSLPATEEIGAMGREIESRQG
jgi:hypothetical protein